MHQHRIPPPTIAWTAPLFPFALLSRRHPFLLCSSFPPSIDSDVFSYRRHFSFFRFYSGVIHSSFLFPHAAAWMARWLSLRTSHRLHHLLYNYASTCSQYSSWTVWSLKMGSIGCAETLANTYQHRQRKNAEERRSLSICFTSYSNLMKPAILGQCLVFWNWCLRLLLSWDRILVAESASLPKYFNCFSSISYYLTYIWHYGMVPIVLILQRRIKVRN